MRRRGLRRSGGPIRALRSGRGKLWLLFPKIVPWKRAEAMQKSRSLDRAIAIRKVDLAIKANPNEAARDAAIQELATLFEESPREEISADAYASILTARGAAHAIKDSSALDTAFGQKEFLLALVQRAAIDEARDFATKPPALR